MKLSRWVSMCICMSLAVPTVASCQGTPEPSSILRTAIEAHGGEKNISKPRKGVLRGTSKVFEDEITQEETFDLPNRWRRVTSGTLQGKKYTSFILMNEGKLWEWEEGGEAREKESDITTGSCFAVITVLLKLMGDDVQLSSLGRIRVNGKPADGIRAVWKDGAGDYYYDATTGLTVQANFKWQNRSGKESDLKIVLGDYKEIDGVKIPHRRTYYIKRADFKDYVEGADFIVTEVRIVDKLPDDVFSVGPKK